MKFNDFKYVRPDIEKVKETFLRLIEKLKTSNNKDEQIKVIKEYHQFEDELQSMIQLVYIRHSIDTKDPFYDKEQEYLNKALPELQHFGVMFLENLLDSKLRENLVY